MPTNIINVGPQPTLLYGTQGSGQSAFTILNTDASNTVYVSDTPNPMVGGSNTLPLLPGASVAFGSTAAVYALSAGPVIAVALLPAGTQYFVPASLSQLGGARVYVQAGQPTGNIPPNSIWFNTTLNALETWNGTAWVIQQLSGQELILPATLLGSQLANGTLTSAQLAAAAGILGSQIASGTITSENIAANTIVAGNIAANTITAAELAANIVYAGIVNGTTITGATLIGEGTGNEGLFYSSSPPSTSNIVASISAVQDTDAPGNTVYQGFTVYGSGTNKSYINLKAGNPAIIAISTGDSSEATVGGIASAVLGSGTGRVLATQFVSPVISGGGDTAELFLESTPVGSTQGAQLELGNFSTQGAYLQIGASSNPSFPSATVTLVGYWKGSNQVLMSLVPDAIMFAPPLVAMEPGSPGTEEVWHPITLDSGWSTVSGHPVPSYRLLPDGNVQLSGYASHAAWTGTTTLNSSNPLPSAYRPATEPYFVGDINRAAYEITSSGVIQVLYNSALNNTQIEMHAIYPTGV